MVGVEEGTRVQLKMRKRDGKRWLTLVDCQDAVQNQELCNLWRILTASCRRVMYRELA